MGLVLKGHDVLLKACAALFPSMLFTIFAHNAPAGFKKEMTMEDGRCFDCSWWHHVKLIDFFIFIF